MDGDPVAHSLGPPLPPAGPRKSWFIPEELQNPLDPYGSLKPSYSDSNTLAQESFHGISGT
jgi:hypothetical protein